jgi:anaerobic selenocysteine-containing dehydrogenase
MTTRSRTLEELSPSVAVRLSPADAERLALRPDELVRVSTEKREVLLRARVDRTVRPSTVVSLWNRGGESAAALMVDHGQPTAVELRRSS